MIKLINLLFSLSLFVVFGISDQNIANIDNTSDLLFGYGYDATSGKTIADNDAYMMQNPILNLNNGNISENIKIITNNTSSNATSIICNSASSFSKQYSKEMFSNFPFQINYSNVDLNEIFNRSEFSSDTKAEKYEFYYINHTAQTHVLQMDYNDIMANLSLGFTNDLSKVSDKEQARLLYDKYGTHLMTGFTLGGRLEISNYQQTTSSIVNLNEGTELSNKISNTMSHNASGSSFSFHDYYEMKENTHNQSSAYNFSTIGGSAISALSIDHLLTYHHSLSGGNGEFEVDRWTNSIRRGENLAVINIPSYKTYTLYELVPSGSEFDNIRKLLLDTYAELSVESNFNHSSNYPDVFNDYDDDLLHTYAKVSGYYQTTNDELQYVEMVENNNVDYGSTISMDYYDNIELENKEWRSSSNQIEIIDKKKGIFYVKGFYNRDFTIELYDKDDLVYSKKFYIKEQKYSGGDGSTVSPYVLRNYSDLQELSNSPDDFNQNFILENDIDCENNILNQIGNSTNPFTGTFNGNGCSIYSFKLNYSGDNTNGLIPVNEGVISNLKIGKENYITNFSVNELNEEHKTASFSLLVGVNKGIINDCSVDFVELSINSNFSDPSSYKIFVGGLVGESQFNSKISNCIVSNTIIEINLESKNKNVNIETQVGGMIGHSSGSTISNSLVTDMKKVSSKVVSNNNTLISSYVGGLLGQSANDGIKTIIDTCIVMYPDAILNSECIGSSSSDFRVNNLIGYNNNDATIENSFYQKNSLNDVANGLFCKDVIDYNNLSEELDCSIWSSDSNGKPTIYSQSSNYFNLIVDMTQLKNRFYYNEIFSIDRNAFIVEDGLGNAINYGCISYETNFDSSNMGYYDVSVYILGMSYSYRVFVNEIQIEDIIVSENLELHSYVGWSELPLEYLNVHFVLENGDELTYEELSNYDNLNFPSEEILTELKDDYQLNLGSNRIIVKFGLLQKTITINTLSNPISELIKIDNTDNEWLIGSKYRLTKSDCFEAVYNDGTRYNIPINELEVIASEITVGENEITILYQGSTILKYFVIGSSDFVEPEIEEPEVEEPEIPWPEIETPQDPEIETPQDPEIDGNESEDAGGINVLFFVITTLSCITLLIVIVIGGIKICKN